MDSRLSFPWSAACRPGFFAALFFAGILLAVPGVARAQNAPESPDGKDGLKVVCWNIEWFPGKRNFARAKEMQKHAEDVSAALREINPDILLAQEIRDWESFARLCEVLPGMRPAVVSAFPSRRTGEYWRQQTAIGSKLPVTAAWSQPWEQRNDLQPPRGFSAAVLRLPGKGAPRYLLAYSLHLKSNLSNSEEESLLNFRDRDESIRQLLDHVRTMEENTFKNSIMGVIIAGDLNTNQDGQFGDNVIKLLKDAGFYHTWSGVPREQRRTWRGGDKFEPVTFDHIFTKGLDRPRAHIVETSEETSDHRPVEIIIPRSALEPAPAPASDAKDSGDAPE